MEIITRAAAAAVVGSVLALLLKKYTPELSMTLSLITGVVIVWISASVGGQITSVLRRLSDDGGVAAIYVSPVLKCVGIGLVTHLAAQVCRDAQQGGVASAVELCGTLCALYISVPLIESLLATVDKLL